jgi:hypothetical protein
MRGVSFRKLDDMCVHYVSYWALLIHVDIIPCRQPPEWSDIVWTSIDMIRNNDIPGSLNCLYNPKSNRNVHNLLREKGIRHEEKASHRTPRATARARAQQFIIDFDPSVERIEVRNGSKIRLFHGSLLRSINGKLARWRVGS